MIEHRDTSEKQQVGHFEPRFITRKRPDGSFKRRQILVPDEEARAAHASMLEFFYEKHFIRDWELRESTFVAGGMPGAQLLDNVLPHAENNLFYQLDLKDAFPSVNVDRLKQKFLPHDSMPLMKWYIDHAYGPVETEKPIVAPEPDGTVRGIWRFIDEYGTAPGTPGLPLGAPCSPYLFNFYLQDMDRELDMYLAQHNLTYTRWLDDITISSPKTEGILGERMRRTILGIIESNTGMKVNHAKSKVHTRTRKPVIVTGVALHPDGRIEPRQQLLEQANEAFYEAHALFTDRKWEISPEEPVVTHQIARLLGHRGYLLSMSVPPYSPEVHRLLRFSSSLYEMAQQAFKLAGEPSVDERREKRLFERDGLALLRLRLGGVSERADRLADLIGTWFPNMNHGSSVIMAETLIKHVPHEALTETEDLYEYYFDGERNPILREARRWDASEGQVYAGLWAKSIHETRRLLEDAYGKEVDSRTIEQLLREIQP